MPVNDTCNWIELYLSSFCTLRYAALLITVGPGTGKSVSRFILSFLESYSSIKVSYFIFRADRQADSKDISAVQTLLRQLLSNNPGLYHCIRYSFRERVERQNSWNFPLLWETLVKMLKSGLTLILLDGLDECDSASRKNLMDHLSALDHEISRRFVITTRQFTNLRSTSELIHISTSISHLLRTIP